MWACDDDACSIYELAFLGPFTEIVKELWPREVQPVSVYMLRRNGQSFYQCNVAVIDGNLLLSAAKIGNTVGEGIERSCKSLLYQLSVIPEEYTNTATQEPFRVRLPTNDAVRKPDGAYFWRDRSYFIERDVPLYPEQRQRPVG